MNHSFLSFTLSTPAILIALSILACGEKDKETSDQSNDTSTSSGISSNAPDIAFYAAAGEDCCGEDPHPVHGIETPDGGFVLCGKGVDSQGELEGFLLKIDPPFPSGMVFMEEGEDYSYSWSQTFGKPGSQEVANGVAASQDAVFVVGIEQAANGTIDRSLRKYDLSTGSLIWATVFPSPTAGTDAAFDNIHITPDGGAILGGFVNGERGEIEGFKSYGNPSSGIANVSYFSAAQLASSSAPDAPTWEQNYNHLGSIRSILPVSEDGYVFVAPKDEDPYTVMRIDGQGNEIWQTDIPNHGEATDLAVLSNAGEHTGFAVTGHKDADPGIDGSVTKLSPSGEILWGQSYGNPLGGVQEFAGLGAGNPQLIFDECWGIQATANGGAVIACGTGIEGCDEYDSGSAIKAECEADPRTKWRGLMIEIDADGNEVWQRTDSFYPPGDNEGAESASEFVIKTAAGNYASVVDQGFGIGLMLLSSNTQ